jgi:hypothetical protein
MEASNYRAAGKLLVDGLAQVQQHQAFFETCPVDEPTNDEHNELQVRPVRIGQIDRGCSPYCLYNWALVIEGAHTEGFASLHNATRVCAIILYNTGLCYMAMGISMGKEYDSFQKALKMYNMAMSLLDLDHETDRLIQLASFNNIGYIMASFYEYSATQECLRSLQYLLTTAGATDDAQREDVMEIRMNVALLYGEHIHAAAA